MWTAFEPWPIEAMRDRLLRDNTLWELCGARKSEGRFDIREHMLEDLARDATRDHVNFDELFERAQLRRVLNFAGSSFPMQSRPDLVLRRRGKFHILEVKVNKVDDRRAQCVLGQPFKNYLQSSGYTGAPPWEGEQDLIKLKLFGETIPVVSCTFLMIDAYAGRGPRWSDIFSSIDLFRATMRTPQVKEAAAELLEGTLVLPLETSNCEARLIACRVVDPGYETV